MALLHGPHNLHRHGAWACYRHLGQACALRGRHAASRSAEWQQEVAIRQQSGWNGAGRCQSQWPCRGRQTWQSRCLAAATETQPAATSDNMRNSTAWPAGLQRQNVVQLLKARGLIQETTSPDLEALVTEESVSVYCGFDPTADSLHLGNLLGIIVLRWFAICGHRPVALLGGATGRVGDPSGKSAERPVLAEDQIERNVAAIGALLQRLLGQGSEATQQALIVNNLDWFGDMPLLTFLRKVGKYARVGTMLAKDSVKTRISSESGISYTEFTYQLLQGYDFVHLAREHGCRAQIGGSDQWGNITAGTDLMRRLLGEGSAPCYGLTFPLLTSSDGKKWGKSEGGALWLSADKLSPFKLYQYLLNNTTDQDVIRYLRMLTFLPLEQIAELDQQMQGGSYKPNTAQELLAREVLTFVHGEQGLQAALQATQALRPGAETALDAASLEAIAGDVPTAEMHREQVVGQTLVAIMTASGLQPSKAASKRMIAGGGVRVNNDRVSSDEHVLSEEDLIEGRLVLLAAGKKNKMLVRVK